MKIMSDDGRLRVGDMFKGNDEILIITDLKPTPNNPNEAEICSFHSNGSANMLFELYETLYKMEFINNIINL